MCVSPKLSWTNYSKIIKTDTRCLFVPMSLTFIVKLRLQLNHLNSEAKPKRKRERYSHSRSEASHAHEAGFLYPRNDQTINETNKPLYLPRVGSYSWMNRPVVNRTSKATEANLKNPKQK